MARHEKLGDFLSGRAALQIRPSPPEIDTTPSSLVIAAAKVEMMGLCDCGFHGSQSGGRKHGRQNRSKIPRPVFKFQLLVPRNELQKGVAVGIYPNEMGRTIMNVTPHVSKWRFSNKMQDLFALIKDGTLMLANNI